MNEHPPRPDTDLVRRLGLDQPPRRPWKRGWAVSGLIAIALLGGIGVYALVHSSRPTAYVTAQVKRGPLTVMVSATGTLQPEDEVDVGAEISGRVDAVKVDFNDHVAKGQVLAVINTDQIRAQLAQAEAALNAAKANVMTAQATVKETSDKRDRAQALAMRGIVSAQDLQTAEADYDRAVAAVAKSKADVDSAAAQATTFQTTLDKAVIRSPIDGVVLDRKIEPGQTVAASFQTPVMFTLATDLARMQLDVDIDEADIGLVRDGAAAMFSVDAFAQHRFDAKLISLRNAPKTVNGVVTYQGVLAVDNRAHLLRPGLTATVDILVADQKDALIVPNGALRFTPPSADAAAPSLPPATNGQPVGRVWVLNGAKPEPRDLKIGHSDGHNTEVLAGPLLPGERVITDIGVQPNGT